MWGGHPLTRAPSPTNKTGLPSLASLLAPLSRAVARYAQPDTCRKADSGGTRSVDIFPTISNPLEQLNREIKRRTDVVDVLPARSRCFAWSARSGQKPKTNGRVRKRRYFPECSMALVDVRLAESKELATPALLPA